MKLSDYIGKVVIDTTTNKRYVINKVDGVFIGVKDEKPNDSGLYSSLRYQTGTAPNDNAVANGRLRFVEEGLNELFINAYYEYCCNEGKYDQYLYYCSKFD